MFVALIIFAIWSIGKSLSAHNFSAKAKLSLFVAVIISAIWSFGNSLSAHNFSAKAKLSLFAFTSNSKTSAGFILASLAKSWNILTSPIFIDEFANWVLM